MYRRNLKCIIAFMLSISLLLTQSADVVYAIGTTQEETNGIPEGITSGYRDTEPIDSSFAEPASECERVRSSSLPASYSSSSDVPMDVVKRENHVTSVKAQEHGTCWAHSAISLAESSYIINEGVTPDSLDYNEYHLVHYGYGKATDSLNLFGGDYNSAATSTNILESGGNNLISLCMFAKIRKKLKCLR